MTHRAALPPALAGSPFRVRDSTLGPSRVRAHDLVAPIWGVRLAAEVPIDTAVRCSAWQLRLPDHAFFAGPTAAELLGIPLPPGKRALGVDVGVPAGRRRFDPQGVVPHHLLLGADDVVVRKGLRLTSVERTWCDLAQHLTLPQLVAAGDALIRRRHPRTTVARLRDALDHYPGRRGLRRLRIAVGLLDDGAESPPESELRIAALAAGLPRPLVNVPVRAPDGRFLARPDMTWPEYWTAWEYEGEHHLVDRRQWHVDIRRFNVLQEHGWRSLRAAASDYRDPRDAVAQVAASLRAHGWSGRRVRHWDGPLQP